jgi:AcrR family transcriptional regulator
MARSTAPRRGPVDADSILAAALTLFAERGYRATTMDDIGSAVGIRGPSLYKHVRSKHDLLVQIMVNTMSTLIRDQQAALGAGSDLSTRLRRSVEAHVRYHAAHRLEAFVGNREIDSLQPEERARVLDLRDSYEMRLRALIEAGCESGEFTVQSARLVSYAILEMGMGVAVWYRVDGELSVDEVAYCYSELALLMVGATSGHSLESAERLSLLKHQMPLAANRQLDQDSSTL